MTGTECHTINKQRTSRQLTLSPIDLEKLINRFALLLLLQQQERAFQVEHYDLGAAK